MRASAKLFFNEEVLAVAVTKSFDGFAGMEELIQLEAHVSDEELALAVRSAWAAATAVSEYDAEALLASWKPACDLLGVERYSVARSIQVTSHDDQLSVLPSEWKGDNRVRLSKERIDLPIDASNEELGAAIRRAMELTVS